MNTLRKPLWRSRALSYLALLTFTLFPLTGACSGFQLLEQSASGMGNAYAGTAASAEDPSTVFFNPAGMTRLAGTQVLMGINVIRTRGHFHNSGSQSGTALNPVGSGEGSDAGVWGYLPHDYFTIQLSPSWTAGLGVNAPFGLKTEYDSDWVGRFHAIKSEVKTVNINPSLAYKITDQLSVGAGLNYQYFEAQLTSAVAYSTIIASVNPGLAAANPGLEGVSKVTGRDTAWGYNFGILAEPTATTKIGFAYRSAITYNLTGKVEFTRPTTANASANAIIDGATPNGNITQKLKLPDTATFSVTQKINDAWDVMSDVSWTGWKKIPDIKFYRENGALLSQTHEGWRNTWRLALAANFKYSDRIKLRTGFAYDQSPVTDEFRTPRLPDNDRMWLSFGISYQHSKDQRFDIGYSHLFVKSATLNDNAGGGTQQALQGTLTGTYKGSADVFGIGLVKVF